MKAWTWWARGIVSFVFVTAFILIAHWTVTSASAAAYYINNQVTCSDSNAGTSSGAPWCNVSRASSQAFASGDTINLARGATWTGQTMTFTESGASGSPIAIQAYGSGNRPKLLGNGLAADRLIKLTNPSYWRFSDLELGNAGAGLLLFYTTASHEGLDFKSLYVHGMNGIVKGVPSNTDRIFFSSGILFTGQSLSVPDAANYVVRNVTMDGIEGTDNQDSVNFDFDNGASVTDCYGDCGNVVQNVILNHLNLHDDDGGGTSNSCSDSLRLHLVSNLVLMNSTLKNEASCYSVSGTAAVFAARMNNVVIVNNDMTDVPDTNSADQVAIDFEWNTNQTKLYGNYFANNAGPALDLLNGAACSGCGTTVDLEVNGNAFENNGHHAHGAQAGSGSIYAHTYPSSGVISHNLYKEGTRPFTYGDVSQLALTNNKGIAGSLYPILRDYGGTQGAGGWRYQYKNGSGAWTDMPSFDAASQQWYLTSGSAAQSATKYELTPGTGSSNADVAKSWTAPSSGTVSIRGRVLKSDIAGGNGVVARITKNGTRIWPASGDQTVAYNDRNGYDTHVDGVTVNAGDVIRFEVGNNGSGTNETTSWTPAIAYTASAESLAYDWGFPANGDTMGWTGSSQVSQSVSGGINTLTSSGSDPYIFSPDNLGVNASTYKFIKIRVKNNTAFSDAELFFTTTSDTSFSAAKRARIYMSTSDAGYKNYVFDMSATPGWTGTIKQLRFDALSGTGTMNVDYIRFSDTGWTSTDYAAYWGFNASGNTEGWANQSQISQSVSGGVDTITASGADPYMYSADNLNIDASTYKKVHVQMRYNGSSASTTELFFTTNADSSFTQAKAVAVNVVAGDAIYVDYVFDFTGVAAWSGTIKQLRFDPINASGTADINSIVVTN
ncbi:hypothetical protein [Paenibacillus sacheonensis]|uniref:Right handed beta helix domain-containing protein n=1 Tax=Paenibacillus sacheonensis TaxID=742054 RepID=A0A7X5C1A7_9BACL|nr:hypothetical protein [Paenibacillus sacheonensis]MBM7568608.1 hypothetical protein [Paenibacillus sacheonensis]NBC72496.1 hypothetical protein [Paenibacillus sacheonensis]